ncbi:MAG: hypothetical protein HYY16_10530 [Planctomycetes bacterium]|nr:hypothetical protein [Planctomycetota bacterium]
MRRSSLVFLLALLGATPAGGQDPPPTFEDLKKSLGELQQKQEREDDEKREALVQKNREETLKIYGDTLERRDGELQNVSRRLEVNKGLQSKYARLLETARAELASMRSQYVNRTIALKRSFDDGKISKEAYEKLLDEDTQRFRNREKELAEDISFYEDEGRIANGLVKDLGVKKELMEFDPFDGDREDEAAPKDPPGIADKVRQAIAQVGGYRPRSVVDTLR